MEGPLRKILPERLFPNYLSIISRGNLKKHTHEKQRKPLQKLALENTDVIRTNAMNQETYGKT